MSEAKRLGMVGSVVGIGLALLCIWPQAVADHRGVKIIGPGELMFLLSFPASLVTWGFWLLPASALFGSGHGVVSHWIAYVWLAMTPPLNWGRLVGGSADRVIVEVPRRLALGSTGSGRRRPPIAGSPTPAWCR